MEHNWDIKYLMEKIVTSSTYKQSSEIKPKQLEKDPDNVYYSRSPRIRYKAETIRDFILASRENWIKIGGFSEDPMWQLHNDSMALGEFCKVQMKQVLFRWPLATFQTLHERGGWIGMNQLSWEEWCELFVQVINGKVDVVKRQIKNS